MTLRWSREQRWAIKEMQGRWRLPGPHTPTYSQSEIDIVRRYAARERAGHRQRLAHQFAIAIGWYAS
jgi:hypothetical protein